MLEVGITFTSIPQCKIVLLMVPQVPHVTFTDFINVLVEQCRKTIATNISLEGIKKTSKSMPRVIVIEVKK